MDDELKDCKYCFYAKERYGIYYCPIQKWHCKNPRCIPQKHCDDFIDMRDDQGITLESFDKILKGVEL